MIHSCDVVQGLLPLYPDEVCSGEGGKLVRDHLRECEKCREMFRLLQADTVGEVLPPDGDEVLKKTSYVLSRRAVYSALGVLSAVVF